MNFSRQITGVYIKAVATVAGPKEKDGPLGKLFDKTYDDYYLGTKNFESGELSYYKEALRLAIHKAKLSKEDLDLLIAGDLNNQIACSSKGATFVDNSFLGIYAACATSMQGVALASLMIMGGLADNIAVSTTSSFATCERQFRYPNEYGLAKKLSTTITVTGSGVAICSSDPSKIRVSEITFGKVKDPEWNDVTDMGTPMSYAAYDTIINHLKYFQKSLSDYDLILTGDLSKIGSQILIDLFKTTGSDFLNHDDCGKMIFDLDKQNVFSGGSGAACCPLVTYTEIFQRLLSRKYKRVLVVATGALHDPTYVYQKKTIPTVAHAVCFERSEE